MAAGLESTRMYSWVRQCPSQLCQALGASSSPGCSQSAPWINRKQSMICWRQSWKWHSGDEEHCYGNSISYSPLAQSAPGTSRAGRRGRGKIELGRVRQELTWRQRGHRAERIHRCRRELSLGSTASKISRILISH